MIKCTIESLKLVHKAAVMVLENKDIILSACSKQARTIDIPNSKNKTTTLFLRLGFCPFVSEVLYWSENHDEGDAHRVLYELNTMYFAEQGIDLISMTQTEWEDNRDFPVPSGQKYVSPCEAYMSHLPIWGKDEYGQERWKYVEWIKQTCELELVALGGHNE